MPTPTAAARTRKARRSEDVAPAASSSEEVGGTSDERMGSLFLLVYPFSLLYVAFFLYFIFYIIILNVRAHVVWFA